MAEYSKDREGNILTDRAPLYKVVAVMFGMSYSEAKRKIAEGQDIK